MAFDVPGPPNQGLNMAGLPLVSTTGGAASDQNSTLQPCGSPRNMQAHDPVDGLQNAASRVLEAISEHDKAAHNTYEPTSGVTGRNVSAFHNGFGFQHGVEPENTADTLPLPLPEPRVDTEAHAIDTVSQDTVAGYWITADGDTNTECGERRAPNQGSCIPRDYNSTNKRHRCCDGHISKPVP
jgi:hypothetical protein